MDRVPQLVARSGDIAGARFNITEEGVVIGRGDNCQIRLDEPGVSREHARVLLHNAGVWVRDAGSRNGVFVNQKRVTRPKSMSPGDVLRVGEHDFVLEIAGEGLEEESVSVISPIVDGAPNRTAVMVVGAALAVAALCAAAWIFLA